MEPIKKRTKCPLQGSNMTKDKEKMKKITKKCLQKRKYMVKYK